MKFKYYPITLLSGALFYGSLSLSQNIKVYNFPLNIENSTITYLVVSLVVGLLIYYLNLNFNENNNIFVISLIVLSAYTLPQILFTITFINRIFFLAALVLNIFLLFKLPTNKESNASLLISVILVFSVILLLQSNTTEDEIIISNEEVGEIHLLDMNPTLDDYKSFSYVSLEGSGAKYFLNPTGRNPYTAILTFDDLENLENINSVNAKYKDEDVESQYNFIIDGSKIYVEAYYLGRDSILQIDFVDNGGNNLATKEIAIPPISNGLKFKLEIEKFSDSFSWMWISGAKDGTALFVDEKSNIRGLVQLPQRAGRTFGASPLYEKGVVFWNTHDHKYYHIDMFGKYTYFFDNDLDKKYRWHHDISPSKHENLQLMLVEDLTNKPFIEDLFIEINIEDNTLVREFDLKNILDFNLPVIRDSVHQVTAFDDVAVPAEPDKYDWFHGNSIEYNPERDEIIISGRHQGLIGIDYESLELNWFIPHNPEFYENNDDYNYPILTSNSPSYLPPNGQHNLTMSGNKIIYFDNQAIPNWASPYKEFNIYDLKSYIVISEVDFDNLTITNQTLISHENTWSKIRGGLDYTDTNFSNYLISFGGIFYDQFGARTLDKKADPKNFAWEVVEYSDNSLVRKISANVRGAYRSLFYTP
tara:strand:- start:3144 stop:5078 length:1935 start_codon:yes stop_codon:yes gene_type:complete